ncbi:hypothetical protein H2201_005723 [Coniosporium apollinis]|uniref:Extracellular membrane protein CFEM domain-containing protein n=1 Tax=Coniosporium apollinis TaxID=61459 RepID=A0ABQ9NP25_9PEZI|nr:hypothetical protein H2201_005723 [Coniosporium apollinis]
MRLTHPSALLLPLLPTLTTAVSLSEFKSDSAPRNTVLSRTCAAVYTQPIPSCTPSDFHDPAACSASCMDGVLEIQSLVQTACADDAVPGNTVIGFFLAGRALEAVCPPAATDTDTETPPVATVIQSVPNNPGPTIGSSTLRLSEVTSSATGLLVETSPSPVRLRSSTTPSPSTEITLAISTPPTTTATPTTTTTESLLEASSTTPALVDTGVASLRPTSTSSSSAEARQTSGGGGGSLLDIGQNGTAGRRGVEMWVWGISFVALGWVVGEGMV